MKNAEYWRGRFAILEERAHQKADLSIDEIEKMFQEAERTVIADIERWYGRFAANNNIGLTEARKMLTAGQLEEFKWTVEKYIEIGEKADLSAEWMKQLENASARFHISRLESVQLQIQQQLELLYGNQLDSIDSHLKEIISNGYTHTAYEIQKGVGLGWDITALNPKKIETLLSKPWTADGKTFRDRCWEGKANLVTGIQKNLTQGLLRGDSPQKITDAVKKQFGVSRYKAGRLVHTETTYFNAVAARESYSALDVERVEIIETLDSHTCEICQPMDGKVIPMAQYEPGVTVPPFHPNCRGTTAPAIDEDILGERAARDADGNVYYVPSNMKYSEWKAAFVDDGSVKQREQKKTLIQQHYKPVNRGESAYFTMRSGNNLSAKAIEGYSDVYVSDNVHIKPKALHNIHKNTIDALDEWEIPLDQKPKIVILSNDEMPTALGRYDAITNVVYYVPDIANKQIMATNGGLAAVEYHEMWHLKQASDFRASGKTITQENYGNYLKTLTAKCKQNVDKLGITAYNVSEISVYAQTQYFRGRYDEVEAEIMTKRRTR